MALTITHSAVAGTGVDADAIIDGADWDASHSIAGSIAASEVTSPAALTKTDDTNVTLTLGGAPTTALLTATSVTVGWTGSLAVTRGGTGAATFTAHGVLLGQGTGAVTTLNGSAGNSSLPLISQGSSLDPIYSQIGFAAIAGFGTGVATALGTNVGSAGAVVVNGGALGTPSSGTVTNLTGTASININGTVGATTPAAGTFTTATASTSVSSPIHLSTGKLSFQSSSTFAGSISTGQLWMFNANDVAPASGVRATVSNNTAAAPALNLPATLSVVGADTVRPVIGIQGFASSPGSLVFGHANGTAASPTATLSGNAMGLFVAYGYHTAGTPGYGQSSAGAGFQMVATDNFTDTAAGSKIEAYTTPTGTVSITLAATFQASGGFSVGTATDPGVGGILANTSIKSRGATAGIGYATGAGGTVTQATSKSTGATLNTACGAITMNGAALAGDTTVSFVLTNSAIAATDVLVLNHISGGTPGSYLLNARAAAGSATIDVRNITTGSLSEAIVIQFALIKGVNV